MLVLIPLPFYQFDRRIVPPNCRSNSSHSSQITSIPITHNFLFGLVTYLSCVESLFFAETLQPLSRLYGSKICKETVSAFFLHSVSHLKILIIMRRKKGKAQPFSSFSSSPMEFSFMKRRYLETISLQTWPSHCFPII